ncbi:MAG TPA: ABC transporter ATP-binding protein [Planctomycetes bacterium]|jgi:ABC-2 type transport system ATP-binding protein|nr:ABC transporter ATP-binding protein [Planctomycetota bacterium]
MPSNASDTPLAVAGLDVSYPGAKVLTGLDLRLTAGEVYGLLGRNAAGKSTLLNTLMRLIEPLAGSIAYFGEDIRTASPATWRRISYLGEMANVLPHWSVERLLDFQAESYGRLRRDLADALLAEFGIKPKAAMRALSRGQQQMVGLIAAIAVEPDLLLLDEAAAALDPVARRELFGRVLDLIGDRRCTALITSHIVSDLERIVDRVGFLAGGRIVLEGSLDELKERCALVPLASEIEVPPGVTVLRRRVDGRALVTGDLDAFDTRTLQRMGLEDLYVELLGL